jgi:hypothetical protein
MRLFKNLCLLSAILSVSSSLFAANQNYFNLILINHTQNSFFMEGITGGSATNVCKVLPTILLPGQEAIMQCYASEHFDIAGQLHLKNEMNDDNVFTYVNYLKYHTGQSIFSMQNERYHSHIFSMQHNFEPKPFTLMYDSVTVIISMS